MKKHDYLYVKVSGKRSVNPIKEATKQIVEKCAKNKYTKVLVDVRGFRDRINFSEIFDLVSIKLPEIIDNKINKVAIVDIKGYNFNKDFFENVAVNRGHNVKIFTDLNNAIQWLS